MITSSKKSSNSPNPTKYPYNESLGYRRIRRAINAILDTHSDRWTVVRISIETGHRNRAGVLELKIEKPSSQQTNLKYTLIYRSPSGGPSVQSFIVTPYFVNPDHASPDRWHDFLCHDLPVVAWPWLTSWLDALCLAMDRSNDVIQATAYNASNNIIHVLHLGIRFSFKKL